MLLNVIENVINLKTEKLDDNNEVWKKIELNINRKYRALYSIIAVRTADKHFINRESLQVLP